MELPSIIDLHWNEDAKMYCDVGISSDGAHFYLFLYFSFSDYVQMSLSMYVIKATFHYSPLCYPFSVQTPLISFPFLTFSTIPIIFGHHTAFVVSRLHIPNSDTVRIIGKDQFGFR